MEEKGPTVEQLPTSINGGRHGGGDPEVEREGTPDIEKIERVYR